jgi:hypothetical protein
VRTSATSRGCLIGAPPLEKVSKRLDKLVARLAPWLASSRYFANGSSEARRGRRQIEIGDNDLEDIVEVVRNPTSECSDQFDSLGAELSLHLPLFRDVGVNYQDRFWISLPVSQKCPTAGHHNFFPRFGELAHFS